MCGIWAVFGLESNLHSHCASTFTRISHRGPDAWRIEYDNRLKNCCVGFHRLSIVDCIYGMQPMKLQQYPLSMLVCNGELYNCKRLRDEHGFKYETYNDVECVFHMYERFGIGGCVRGLDGVFAFALVDLPKRRVFLARDPYGVRPLFRLLTDDGTLGICSEAKGLVGIGETVEPFPPGTFEEYEVLDDGKVKFVRSERYFSPGDRPGFKPFVPYEDLVPGDHRANVRKLLTASVAKRLMADRRIGCLLSGGLDSSLVAAILVKEAEKAKLPYKIQSFAVGMSDSPDLLAARKVAEHVGTEHHEVVFTERQVADVLDSVIEHLETPDLTTVRASVPMYIVSRYIKENTDTTVVFSGEGADEVAQGYIYFRDAPGAAEAHEESLRLLREIYLFDGLRADRTTAAHSLELRVPFLDLQFTHYYLSIEPSLRRPKDSTLEKYLLRSSFDSTDLLPADILWRHKEAFSDGVASTRRSLFEVLRDVADSRLGAQFDARRSAQRYAHLTPTGNEALYYRETFEKGFPGAAGKLAPHYWMPRWVEGVNDPSARFITHYKEGVADAGDGARDDATQ